MNSLLLDVSPLDVSPLDVNLTDAPFLATLYGVTGLALLLVLLGPTGVRRAVVTVIGAVIGAASGWVLAWFVSDVWDPWGVSLSIGTRLWTTALFASVAIVLLNLRGQVRWRQVVAICALPLCLLSAATGINADVGQFPTLRVALGLATYAPLDRALASGQGGTHVAGTTGSTGSSTGTVGTVTIPGTVSGFAARSAMVYLPPAATGTKAPALPVVEMLSGQPGSPSDVFTAGGLADILDRYAQAHSGLAPIVVVPDQLGSPKSNPMCVDSALGQVDSYLTIDVPAWIRAHLHVRDQPNGWTIAGFSQGGTCSIQLGAAHPQLFGTILDIAGELVPKYGSEAHTVAAGFGGSAAAYAAAAPTALLAAHAPYGALGAIFVVGDGDLRFLPGVHALADAAKRAGVDTHLFVSPGTAHDWHTVDYAWATALPVIAARTALLAPDAGALTR
ncbi:MAG: esterase family protein [Cryobacterium sp.]|uniref:alpha/beta hydrolase n=1 Tax=unclassified Cryobacterium TaxID=2649013 RepID=UPI0018CBCB82|nr:MULTISPECIES: alpha/beta hydrolase-fold protein [unclassified Cryobacterium]MCY7404592.1 esterase family protein [Cryobacterium sp.]MEC5153877.1 enterochelin esterase-like enzyme [Cryobacterium sp. CAN_C3]